MPLKNRWLMLSCVLCFFVCILPSTLQAGTKVSWGVNDETYLWYPEGAELILTRQKNGRWGSRDFSKEYEPLVSTCFALLFLKRATNTIVETKK